ncbi:hypothetical protein L596_014011 [Steinernema carpocapsae]|uniref:Uncharacterized protein n=1 Tax=Steinernema carpocapsae TaxID=34508 RepID=A0A4U5NBG0_STECR|nr:hypothetical protein L596_014011 [Steinernema carpocapsae]
MKARKTGQNTGSQWNGSRRLHKRGLAESREFANFWIKDRKDQPFILKISIRFSVDGDIAKSEIHKEF